MNPNNLKNIQCVIFDCDGVLVDSEILASQVALRMLAPYGFTMNPSEYAHKFAGKVEEDILSIIECDYRVDLPDDFLHKLLLEIEYALDHELQPIPNIKQAVEQVPVTKAVVSNSRLVKVISSLKVAGLSDVFGQRLFAAEMVERPKPAPDVYLYAARQLATDPTHCLVIEDSQSGVRAAHEAGMMVIGFLAASHIPEGHEQTLRQEGAFTTVANAEELRTLFQEIFDK